MSPDSRRPLLKLTKELRIQAGRWLRALRERRGLSQRELAQQVGAEYYTLVSQLEHGRGRIPPDHYLVWADALGVDKREFVRRLMSHYDPVTHGILFGQDLHNTVPGPSSREDDAGRCSLRRKRDEPPLSGTLHSEPR